MNIVTNIQVELHQSYDAGLFLGSWDLEAYVCLGRDKDTETPVSWVMTVGAEPENPTLWDPVTAERFRASDPEVRID
jgi:hypothetical protein